VQSHVHTMFVAHPMTEFSRLIGHLKGGSATLWNKEYAPAAGWKLKWAAGYGLSTISPRQQDNVRRYLRAQPFHHPTERIEGWGGDRPGYESLRRRRLWRGTTGREPRRAEWGRKPPTTDGCIWSVHYRGSILPENAHPPVRSITA
jgi:hypothetical protein